MENTQITDEAVMNEKPQITDEIMGFLNEIRRWTKFLSILGFIGCGIMVLVALLIGPIMSSFSPMSGGMTMFPSIMISIIYLAIAVLYFFPVLYLFRFSVSMGRAAESGSNDEFNSAFFNLKRHYKFIGIMTIVIISLYILIILLGIVGGIAGGMFGMF
ncbi:DUF5362 family protein [Bacteroidota bacterium]